MLWLGLRVAGIATAVALALGPWLAWLLARSDFRGKRAADASLWVALILPPPVVVYCLLYAAGRLPAFTWQGAAAAGSLASVPLLVWRGRAAFAALDLRFGNAARTLGAAEAAVFWRIELPLVWRPLLGAAGLVFGRVLTETALALALKSAFKP